MRLISRVFIILLLLLLPASALAKGRGAVVIDPGHGGFDTGIETAALKEKDVALQVAKQMKEVMESMQRGVYLTRKSDAYAGIDERRGVATVVGPDLFISIHLSDSDAANIYVSWAGEDGTEPSLKEYYSLESNQQKLVDKSSALMAYIKESLEGEFKLTVRKRHLPLALLNPLDTPAVIVELPSKGIDYNADALRVASALVLGILNYEQSR